MVRTGRNDGEDGFTIIEVVMAALILLVGILGVTTIVNQANSTTTSTKAREQGLALARELLESSRSIKYQSLRPTTVVPTLQAMPGFANAGIGAGWSLQRRGITYHVSVGVCSVDDPGDGTGAHVAGTFCTRSTVQATGATCQALVGMPPKINGAGGSPGADGGDCGIDPNLDGQVDNLLQSSASSCPAGTTVAAGTCDAQPDDFKRLVTLVTWDRGSGSRFVVQSATVSFPGLSAYGAITTLTLNSYTLGANGYAVNDNPTSLSFAATSSQQANQVDWLLDGVDRGPISSWSGTSGSFTWNLGTADPLATSPSAGEVLDGAYSVGARVQDAGGIHGNQLAVAVLVNRRKPFPPTNFNLAGAGTGTITGAWTAPPDNDVIGYHMWRKVGAGVAVVVCTSTTPTCSDTNPPSSGTVEYWATAIDLDQTGAQRDGQLSNSKTATAAATNAPPTAPTNLQAGWVAGNGSQRTVTLTWTAASDPDNGIQFYKIYRSTASGGPYTLVNTQSGNQLTFSEGVTKNTTYYYYVLAVDNGALAGPASSTVSVAVA
jgi:Tfp pilus assembly protein PilV